MWLFSKIEVFLLFNTWPRALNNIAAGVATFAHQQARISGESTIFAYLEILLLGKQPLTPTNAPYSSGTGLSGNPIQHIPQGRGLARPPTLYSSEIRTIGNPIQQFLWKHSHSPAISFGEQPHPPTPILVWRIIITVRIIDITNLIIPNINNVTMPKYSGQQLSGTWRRIKTGNQTYIPTCYMHTHIRIYI